MNWKKATEGNYTLSPATQTTLGGVKVGSGMNVDHEGTISVKPSSNNGASGGGSLSIVDVYIISGSVRGMGPAELNRWKGISVLIDEETVLEVIFTSGNVKRFKLASGYINVGEGETLRINYETGDIRVVSSTTQYSNEALLVRVGTDLTGSLSGEGYTARTTLVLGGYLMKYFYPNGKASSKILSTKNVKVQSLPLIGMQSINNINGELWFFDKNSNTGSVRVFDPSDTTNYIRSYSHSKFHFNTSDYNPNIDALCTIWGWGQGRPLSIKVLHGLEDWGDGTSGTHTIDNEAYHDIIDVSYLDDPNIEGEGSQPVWGEDNNGENNIVYVLIDEGVRVVKLLLGKGDNNYGSGGFRANTASHRFNGSFKVLGDWVQINSLGRPQDALFYNGAIYVAHDSGSDSRGNLGVIISKLELHTDGRIERSKIHIPIYNEKGIQQDFFSGGITLIDDQLLFASGNGLMKFEIL